MNTNTLDSLAQFYRKVKSSGYAKVQLTKEDTLYHYTNIYGLMGILESNTFWISKSDFLNDPAEISYVKDIIEEVFMDYINMSNAKETLLYKAIKVSIDELQNIFSAYILSLTEEQDSMILWSSYSKFDGYNLGIDINNITFGLPVNYLSGKVIYLRDKQKEMIKDIVYDLYLLYKDYSCFEESEYFIKTKQMLLLELYSRAMFFKRYGFRDEREYRIVFCITDEEREQLILRYKHDKCFGHKICNGCFIPYLNMPFKYTNGNNIGKFPLRCITIGPKNNLDIAEKGLQSFLDILNFKNVDILKSNITLRY